MARRRATRVASATVSATIGSALTTSALAPLAAAEAGRPLAGFDLNRTDYRVAPARPDRAVVTATVAGPYATAHVGPPSRSQ
ncbi:hypothetical protein OG559_08145 [Micromonospora sp. NBC_01405]|uniref:hypothetical protein n=1 Tax=Micromonospora sp. NBC_01405 TaxID=2903589 RepID=UPI003253D551